MAMRYGNSLTPDRELWQMVVLRALMDALVPGREDLNKDRAHRWLTYPNRDFTMVCNLAGFDPEFIRDAYKAGRIDYVTISNSYSGRFHAVAA